MMPLPIIVCAIFCLSSALTIAIQEEHLDNQILVTGEVTLPDCKIKDFSRWDKVMTTLENSHMRQNMLIQYAEDMKMELEIVRTQVQLLEDKETESCSDCLNSVATNLTSLLDSKCQADNSKNQQKSVALSLDIANRLQRIENLLEKREEAEENKSDCLDKGSDDADKTQKLDLLIEFFQRAEDWIRKRQLPSGCDVAILFPMRSPKIYASVHPAEISLQALTFCVWTKVTEALDKTIVFSYGTKRNPYEIQLYFNQQSVVFVVGGDNNKISADVVEHGDWSHSCGTWNNEDGKSTLWINGQKKADSDGVAQGHVIPDKGIFQLGQEKNGCCVGGGFDESLAFSGKITGFNLWNSVLSDEKIIETGLDTCSSVRGNVIGWGTTEIQAHGGAQYIH
ncbi:pentraxin-related protein PTX3 [Hyperolius riggenbachi]|uniref:pentraxin-related protein PTX3 n=1 Tax=Hyperolius riggenbachi TaxID=752182 RepID=UPI0035A2E446